MEEDDVCDLTITDKFQEPKKKFWLRSRKRPKSDAVSINSMDVSLDSTISSKRKKRRKISEVASSFFGSNSSKALDRTINVSEVSFSDVEPTSAKKKMRMSNDFAGTVAIRSWMLDVAELDIASTLSRREIKRQEAIYELFCGENVMLNDLCILRDFYYQPLQSTNIFTTEELDTLFGDLSKFIQVHGKLRDDMVDLRDRSGFTECLGPTFVDWLAQLKDIYVERCRTQIWARYILKMKLSCKRFQEFLKKKSETLRSADLWTYLDVPRSRIVKYPLLVSEILRHTPGGHVDEAALKRAKEILSDLLKDIDQAMGDAECKLAQTRINIRPDYDPNNAIQTATDLITEGYLKDQKGTKYYCFLFNTCFALTRSMRRANAKYNLCFPVIPADQLNVQIITPNKAAASFKIGDHILLCDDEHHRRHWLDSFKRLSLPRSESRRKSQSLPPNEKGKENEPEVPDCIKTELSRRLKNNMRNGYFTISLRKALLRHTRNSIEDL